MDVIAERFARIGASWVDLASGFAVRLVLSAGGSQKQQLAWSDRCASLAVMRHPLINPLVDYGAADPQHTFEAYAISPALEAPGDAGRRLLAHVARFLESQGIPLTRAQAERALRSVTCTDARTGRIRGGRAQPTGRRPLGVVLQRRRVLDQLSEALHEAPAGGVLWLDVEADSGFGLRTLRAQAARAARLAGYVPLAGIVVARLPRALRFAADRHVCLLLDDDGRGTLADRTALARLIGELGLASARRHVLICFRRSPGRATRGRLRLGPLGVTAMTSMVYLDPEDGPASSAIWDAARAADGNPARFLARLHAASYPQPLRGTLVVHESRPRYSVTDPGEPPPAARPSTPTRLESAPERADALASRGRHAAAERLLLRAVRVLEGRGQGALAGRCAERLAWILRERGRTAAAAAHAERARALAATGAARIGAGIALGVLWTDDERLIEAEAALRSAQTAAELTGARDLAGRAILALARALYWQRRFDEAAISLAGLADAELEMPAAVRCRALSARVYAALGDRAAAMASANDAVRRAGDDPRLCAVAARTMAAVQVAAGDLDGARRSIGRGLAAAATAHAPLYALRLRALLLAATPDDSPNHDRCAAHVRAALRRGPVPALIRRQIDAADVLRRQLREQKDDGTPRAFTALADLRGLLELAHAASSDQEALERLGTDLLRRLRAATILVTAAGGSGRVLAHAGRPWHGDPHIVQRALAGAANQPSESVADELEAATVIRYGDEAIGTIACRWTAGTAVDAARALDLLRAAALAIAPSVRSLLDRGSEREASDAAGYPDLIGTSPPMAQLRAAITRAARAPFPVLVEGESGSGKELVARAIHRLGPRRERRLCAINCAALSDELVEAELFGHARGAYTGAVGERAGLFEEADGGTLFLDEIGELSARAQAKLLRVLQDGEVRRVGENFARRVDTRIVAATNRELEHEADAGRFRSDLRYRLDVIRIRVPPLRDRASDIPALASHFWEEAMRRLGFSASLAPDTVAMLARYEWPGNVRELQNTIASLAVHSPRRGRVLPQAVPAHVARAGVMPGTFEAARTEFERRFVAAALARAGGRRTGAARALGITRQGLTKMLRRLKMDDTPGAR